VIITTATDTKDRCWVLYPHLKPITVKGRGPEENLVVGSDDNIVHNKLEQLTKQMECLMTRCVTGKPSVVDSKGEVSNSVQHTCKMFALSTSHSSIIVDSGASDNIFTFGDLLSNFLSDSNYPHFTVVNGLVVPTNSSGIVHIFSKEIEVTVVPGLKTNMLSISKCTDQLGCNVLFTPQKVIFHDLTFGRMIGEG
jgi:hypothetical protein